MTVDVLVAKFGLIEGHLLFAGPEGLGAVLKCGVR